MAEIWGINDPVVDDEEEEIWGINDPTVEDEEDQEEVWGINDPVIDGGETPEAEPVKPPIDIVKQYGEVSERYNQKGKALTQASERFQQLATQPERTPEEEEELAASWKATVRGQADISQDAVELKRLQPEYDKYFADQKQARIDYIEDRRGSGVFGDEAAEALYDIDARAEQEYAQARTIEDTDKRKEAMAAIQAKYQAEEKNLTNQYVERFKENETKINNAAEVIGQAFAKGQTVDQFLLETGADAPEFNELRDSLLNQDDSEKGKLFREARAMVDLAEGAKKVGIVNNEIRISPLHVWDAEGIKAEIAELDISEAKKRTAIKGIAQLQQEAAKFEYPWLKENVSEFNSFVKDNNLENVSPERQIAEWKGRNDGWLSNIPKTAIQSVIGLRQQALGFLGAGQTIVGATASILGAQEFADPFLDAATKTSDEIDRLERISQEIGGPTLAKDLASGALQVGVQIGFGGAVGFGAKRAGFKPKTVSNIGFGSSVGAVMAQSYGGVLSSAIQTLEKEKIDGGMDPTQARAEAIKEAQLPAALSALIEGTVTVLGGKRGSEAPFRDGPDAVMAKLNTPAFKAQLDRFAPNLVGGGAVEGVEELIAQFGQGLVEQATFNPSLTTSEIVNNSFKALIVGGMLGGGVEGLKYGFDYMKAPKAMARREASMASIRQSIADAEREISDVSASSPIGSEFQREYDATLPSDEAANLGGVAVDRTRMNALQAERQQLSELLEDTTISRVARNQLEGKLAAADLAYYNEVLTPMRRNVVNEQMVDQLDGMVVSQQTKDGLTAMAKIANGLGAESLTGRERVAVGITSIGGGRFIASKKNPMVEVSEAGEAKVTEAGRLMAENVGMVPLVRMIGLSESTRAKQAEMERVIAEAEARKAQQDAKDTAESEEAKRYGPESAEALKQQTATQPPVPEAESNARLAQLLKEQEEAARLGEEAVTRAIETRFIESFRSTMSEAIIPTAERAATIDLNNFRDVINSIAQEIDKGTFNIELVEQGEFKNILPEQAFTTVVEAFRENPQRALNALRAFGDEVENAVKEFGGGAAGEPPENLEPLRRVARAEQTPEDVTALTDAGLVEVYKDQPILTQAGIDALPEAERPRLTPEARKIQIDTGANEVVAEAISKGLRIGVDQVGPNVTMPEGWTLDGDVYIPPAPPVAPPVEPPVAPPVQPTEFKDGGIIERNGKQYIIMGVEERKDQPARLRVKSLKDGKPFGKTFFFGSEDPKINLVQPPVAPPVTPPPVAPTTVAITEEQANNAIKAAQEERARKPAPNIGKSDWGPQSVSPKQSIGKTAREALKTASRLNLSKIAQSNPNEIMMQDVAAILAELDMPILDLEPIVSLSSLGKKGRPRRFPRGENSVVGLPSTIPMPVATVVHEIGHTITADQIKQYLPREKFARGKAYLDAINKVIADPKTPEPISRLFSLYVSTIEQLGIADQYFAVGGIAGGRSADASKALAQRAQAKGLIRKDIKPSDFYGLANLEEFVSQTFSEPSFRNLLKSLKDPTNPRQSLWQAFVDAIQRILELPKGSMAAAVIEASVDVGMTVEPARVKARGAAGVTPAPAPEPDMAPEPETGKTVEMSLEMEKERTFQLLGERLYTAELPKVVVKETVQNGFDAIKDSEETGEIPRGSGVIAYSRKELEVNGEKIVRMMFSDNGGGMTPEILQNAFFTVGGTFKRSGKGSGGFGLAKLGMFMSADRVMVETVRDGVVTKADLTKQELVDKKFNVNVAEDANRQNGTMVILEFKQSITRSDGKTVQFENPYTNFEKLIHHNLRVIDDSNGTFQEELIGLFQNKQQGMWSLDEIGKNTTKKTYTFEEFVKDAPNVETFEQDFVISGAKKPIKVRVAATRLGLKRKDGKAKWFDDVEIAGQKRNLNNHSMSVYSNGLFQFEQKGLRIDPMKMFNSELLPYSIVVDIDAGGLDAASLAYPFTNSREDFQNGVVKDYVNKMLDDIRAKERQRQFDQEFGLLTDISGGKPRKDSPTLYNNTTIVPEPSEQKFLEDLSRAVFDVADDLVVALRKGNEDNILEDDWYKVKSQKGSVAPVGRSKEDSLDYFYGVGISKNWGGVNTSREPVSALVNPIYEERVDEYAKTEFGRRVLARTIAKTLIHEINHHLHRNEGSDFTFFILQNEAYLGEVGAIQSAVDKILPIVNQYSDAIISLKNKFRTAETKDTDNELTGEQYERSSKEPDGQPRTTVVGGDRVVQQPSAEVSPRPTSEEDGEQTGAYLPSSLTVADRQDAGVGEGISFGEALSGSLVENQAQINEEGVSRAEGVEPAPEEEFEIVPEQVEDQIEGTPEAATISVMGQAFQMANEQSATMGTPEGTLPLETITNAWMNSGRDVETLENAIIRYTNLEPEAAATLAQAIGKQVEIQRGIMEISDAASRRKAEKEAEPEVKPYSFAQRIKEDLPPELQNKIELAYEVLRNEVSVEEANRVMSGLTLDEAIKATTTMDNGVSMPVRSMMAQIVLRKIMDRRKSTKGKRGKEGDYRAAVEAHVEFLDFVNDYFKELGQGVQAIARFSDLGADGVLLKVRRDIDKAISKHIKNRKGQIDKIKRDVEDADNAAFNAAVKSNKGNIDKTARKAGEQEAKKLTIEEQAQKLAIRAAKKVAGEEVRRRQPDPLSDLVNGHLRRYNANFIAEATAMGVSPVTAQAIEDSAKKLRDSRQAAKSERERFKEMQDERMRVKKELARENKYIYGPRPTIWENYQDMFSERLARRLMRDPKKKVPPSLLLFTDRLTENLLGFIPEAQRQATTQRSFQAMIEDALNNKEKYQEAFNRALEDISLKVMELEVREAAGERISSATYKKAVAAQEFLERLEPMIQQFPVSDKLIMRFVNQKMKAMGESLVGKYNDWYRSSKKTRIEIEKALAEKLVADLNVSDVDAANLSIAIVKDFRAKAEERREKALARFKKPKEKTKRLAESPLKKFFELVNIGAMTDQDAYEVMAHRFELPTWDPKFAKQIEEMALIIQDMPEGMERRRLTRNMMGEIARRKGFSLSDLGSGFFYSNMLSSVETFLINFYDTLFGNWANGFFSSVADKDFARFNGLVAGYRKGWMEAVQVFRTGLRINMPRLEEKTPLTVELINYGRKGGVALESTEGMNAIAKTILESPPAKVLNLWKYVTRIMEATDALNYTASAEGQRYAEAAKMAKDEGLEGKEKQKRINQILNLGDGVYQAALKQAEQEGYTGNDAKFRAMEIQDNEIDAELRERSFNRALTDVYRNMPTGLAGFMAAQFNNITMRIANPWFRNAFKLFTAPFVITPTNLFNRWLDYSPYGYKRLFYGSGNLLDKDTPYYVAPPKRGSAEFYTQALKASSSAFVMLLAGGLVKAGLLTLRGMGPSDEEERKQWLDDGNRPHTFSFMGGPQISYQFSPWALVLSWLANYQNWEQYNAKEDASGYERTVVAMTSATSIIMDLPFFSGPAEFMQAVQTTRGDVIATPAKYIEGKMGMVFPNLVRQIDRIFDPTLYDSQGLKGIIIDQMPFARRLGTQRVNLFGDPIGEDKPMMDRLVGRIASFPPKPSRESRILAKYDIYPYMPSPKEAKALVDGEQAQMTEEQYNKFVQIVGKDVKKRINDLFDPDAEITEKERERGKKRISQIFERARARAVREVSTY